MLLIWLENDFWNQKWNRRSSSTKAKIVKDLYSANMHLDPNLELETSTWIGGELWCGQAQNGINFDF